MRRTTAWRRVAEAFGTPWRQRTLAQKHMTRFGMCYGLTQCDRDLSTSSVILFGWDTLPGQLTYFWPPRRAYDGHRALFAGLMAAMTQRERDRLEPGL